MVSKLSGVKFSEAGSYHLGLAVTLKDLTFMIVRD